MKAIVPAAGVGTRLRPHTHTAPKVLLNVAGRPILAHILDEILELGVDELVLIVGYMGDRIRQYVDSHYDISVHYVEQPERLGLGHAVFLARDMIREGPTLIVLGDTIFDADFKRILSERTNYIGVKAVDDPSRFGIVELDGNRITRLVEKPDDPPTNLAIVGIYYLSESARLFQALDTIITNDIRTRGEYQLTDALQQMLEAGEEMCPLPVEGWFDCGKRETLLATNRHLLDRGMGVANLDGAHIVAPVAIDPSAVIEGSVVGPYVSIAEGVTIRNAIIRDSIVNERARVEDMLLDGSVVGEDAVVRGGFQRLSVGDSSEIELG